MAIGVFPAIAAAAAEGALTEQLQRCLEVEDRDERLACFETVVRNQPVIPPRTAEDPLAVDETAGRRPAAPDAAAGRDVAARDLRKRGTDRERDRAGGDLVARVVKTKTNIHGFHTFWLANGEVWRQTEAIPMRIPSLPFTVTIAEGALGGYRLNVGDSRGRYRVRRLR